MADYVDCVVIGAGVVGLAVARACAQAGLETVVLESENAIGTQTSSRNSEVIHAGIYYAPGSLKARLCVQGREALYPYCHDRGVATQVCGKLVVAANNAQRSVLARIQAWARANGVQDVRWLEAAEMHALEPALAGAAALLSPSTGIVDSHGLMLALQGDFEAAGGMVAFCSPFVAGRPLSTDNKARLELDIGGDSSIALRARHVINCAGLSASDVAQRFHGLRLQHIPRIRLAKGNYFSLAGRAPFSRLIYPVPEPGGLGIHLTLDLNGRVRFGPDVELIDSVDYSVSTARATPFYTAIRCYWPELPDGALSPDYAGIRPQLSPKPEDNGLMSDFLIQDETRHGMPGLVNLFGIESPGLTACLAIAQEVLSCLQPDGSGDKEDSGHPL